MDSRLPSFSLLLSLLLIACGGEHMPLPEEGHQHEEHAETQEQGDGEAEAEILTYQQDIQPLFEKRCSPCHNAQSDLPNWLNYEVAFERRERIYQRVVVEESMPLNNATDMTQEEREMVARWIDQGALQTQEEVEFIQQVHFSEGEGL